MEKISVIVPCFNEEKALPLFYEELIKNINLFPENVEFEILQELVDKETPKKPIKEIISDAYDCDDRNIDFEWERTKCPHCDDDLINEYENRDFEDYDYCPFCGGRLDWSGE